MVGKTLDELILKTPVWDDDLFPILKDWESIMWKATASELKIYTKDWLVASDVTDFQSAVSSNSDVANATNHIANTSNPHWVTKTQVWLWNVANVDTTTTANITDSTDKRFMSDAQEANLDNQSWVNTWDNATNSQYSWLATSKQDTLVSWTNIKTINWDSILGSGDLTVSWGHTIQDEGTSLTQRTKLNFIGASVTVEDDAVNDATKVTIVWWSGSGDVVASWTLTADKIILGNWTTQVKASTKWVTDLLYLDQTTPQTVTWWVPIFQQWVQAWLSNGTSGWNITAYATLWEELFTSFDVANWTLTAWWEATNDWWTQLNKNANWVTTATLLWVSAVIWKTYKITLSCDTMSVWNFSFTFWGQTSATYSTNTTISHYLTASTTAAFIITPSTTASRFTINSISIKEVNAWTWQEIIEWDLLVWWVFKKPDWTVFMRVPNNASPQFLGTWTSSFAWPLAISWALSWATTIAATNTITSSQSSISVRDFIWFDSASSSTSTANTPTYYSPVIRFVWKAWDTANRAINRIQGVIVNAQESIASRMRWSYDFNWWWYSEVMNIENNWTLNILWTSLWTESLTNWALTSWTSWTRTGDFALTSNAATYTHSTGAWSITQAQASLAVALVGNRWYKFTFTTSAASWTAPTIYIPNTVAQNTTQIREWTNWTYSIYFKTVSSPTDFVVSGLSGTTWAVTLDTLSLKEVSGGSLYSDNIITKTLGNLSTNWFVKTSWSNGTLSVDTASYVPTSRSLTINWTEYDLSADRSWTITTDPDPIRIRIPWELIADANIHQWIFWRNTTWSTITISNVKIKVAKAAAWAWAAAAFNIYKSSWTDSNWIDTSATNLFTNAIDLTTNYTDDTNVPDTATVEDGRWISLRCTSSAGATNKAEDVEVIIYYS